MPTDPQTPLMTRPPPSRLDLIGRCFRKALSGWGRASRREFWSFAGLVLLILVGIFTIEFGILPSEPGGKASDFFVTAIIAALMVLTPPLFFAGMRRYHDLGRSGWLYTLHMFSGFGTFFALFAMIAKSYPAENRHGPLPPEAKV